MVLQWCLHYELGHRSAGLRPEASAVMIICSWQGTVEIPAHESPTPSLIPGSGKGERIAFPSPLAGPQKNPGVSPKCSVPSPLFCAGGASSWSGSRQPSEGRAVLGAAWGVG